MADFEPTQADLDAVKQAEAQRDAAYKAWCDAKAAVLTALAHAWRVPKGTRVIDGRGVEFVVDGVEASYGDKPWLQARKIRKDGQPSERVQTIYRGWRHYEPTAAPSQAGGER